MNVISTEGVRVHVKRLCVGLTVIVTIIAVLGGNADAEEADTLCIHFTGSAKSLLLQLKRDYSISGVLPFTACELELGETYRTTVSGDGFERRIGTFAIDRSGRSYFGGIRIRAALRNALLPGWGSVYAQRAPAAFGDGLSLAASLVTLYLEDRDYRDLRDNFDTLYDRFQRAQTFEEKQKLGEAVHIASREVNIQNRHRKRLIYLSAYLYGYQVLEPWLAVNPPRMRAEAGGSVIDVGSARSTRFKALLYSLVRPGRGQFYQGKTARGVFFSTMSITAGLFGLDYHNRYEEEVIRYNLAVDKYLAASTIDERNRYRDEAAELWDEVEKQKRRRNAAYIALAGLWGLSLLDTLFPGEIPAPSDRYALDIGGTGAVFVVRF